MKDRVIQQLGTPNDIYRRPANRFVASFVGSPAMNFLPGTFAVREGVPFFAAGEISIQLNGYAFDTRPQDGAPIELGIRPEHIERGGDLDAVIEIVEPMGSDQLAWLRLGGQSLSMRLPADTHAAIGEQFTLHLPADKVNLFDAASGRRL
jgi:multiple sugar transport system ATP-binding protein